MIICVFLMFNYCVKSQEVKRTLGVGIQSSYPIFGLSAKYGISNNMVVQATVAPFSTGIFSTNFYGGRFLYRWPGKEQNGLVLDPYLYGSGGLLTFKIADFGYGTATQSFFGYSIGGGVELIIAKQLGLSLEAGYGKLQVTAGLGVTSLTGVEDFITICDNKIE